MSDIVTVKLPCIKSLSDACRYFEDILACHPERDLRSAQSAVMAGESRKHPCLTIGHLIDPQDTTKASDDFDLPAVEMPVSPEADLARAIIGMAGPLKMCNPIKPCFDLSVSGALVGCFGVPLNPQAGDAPAFTKSIEQILADSLPNAGTSAWMLKLKDKIKLVKEKTPAYFKMGFVPDGPFNLAHALVGNEAFMAPYSDPAIFHHLMDRITNCWLDTRRIVLEWIGGERLDPWYYSSFSVICECSVNLISPDMYKEFVLPYDKRIAERLGAVAIHPCSGPHVFRTTLENIPNVVYTEAGQILQKTAAGSISVEQALATIGKRDIILGVGQELPQGQEVEFIKNDLDLYRHHKRLLFSYTGMHWRKKDRPLIRDIHRCLDDYWYRQYIIS